MHVTREFHPQAGLRRVLEAFKITTDEWNETNDLAMPSHATVEHAGGKIVYLSDLRKRMDRGDGPSDPRPGAVAARPYDHPHVLLLRLPKPPAVAFGEVGPPYSPPSRGWG